MARRAVTQWWEAEDYLSLKEVSGILKVHRNTVSRYLIAGQFPGAFRLRDWRIPPRALRSFLRSHQPGHLSGKQVQPAGSQPAGPPDCGREAEPA